MFYSPMISPLNRLFLTTLFAFSTFSSIQIASAVIRDGGVDPANLGQGGWILYLKDATNHLAPSGVASVTNENSLFKYMKEQGFNYVIVKAGTSNVTWNGSFVNPSLPPIFTSNLVQKAHDNGLKIFGSNRSWGQDIPGEAAIADYVFQQGADGFIYDAEAEWESSRAWIGTNGPALAWQLCSTVRSNWPTKFIAHNPFDTAYLHFSFPFKEFGYWCDAVMPQVYHHSASSNNAIAAIHWTDWNYAKLHDYLSNLPPSVVNGETIYWSNSIKPLVLMRDVYNGQSGTPNHPSEDVRNFLDYLVADPNCVTPGGYKGSDYFRSELHRAQQWAYMKASTIGNFTNVVNNIILDDARASAVGTWTMVKTMDATNSRVIFSGEAPGDTNSFGTNYWRKAKGTGTNYMQYTPNIIVSGNYDLLQWSPTRTNASTNVPFVIKHGLGTATNFVNQTTNAGNWTLIGRFNFAVGTNGYIRVTDNVPEPSAVPLVDGLKLVFIPVPPAAPSNLVATAINDSEIALRWKDNSTNETGFIVGRGDISGGPYIDIATVAANLTNYTDSGLLDNVSYYYVVRARGVGADSTNSAEATAQTPPGVPRIVVQPAGQTIVEGQTANFAVEITSSTPPNYQWRFNGADVSGATNSSYTLSNVTKAANDGSYSVVINNQIGSVTSAPAVLVINYFLHASANPPAGGTILVSPDQVGYTSTNTVNLIATANPDFVFVGWSQDVLSTSNSINVTMTSSKTLVANFISTADLIIDNPDATYAGVWTIGSAGADKYGSYYQYASTQPGFSGAADAFYTPNIIAAGRYDVSIWYSQGTNRTQRAQVLVAYAGDALQTTIDQTTGGGKWHLIAAGKQFAEGTDGFVDIGNNTDENNRIVVADAVRFTYNTGPLIYSQPQSLTVNASENATFSVLAASSGQLAYQWRFNGANIAGATSSSYTRSAAQGSDAGNYTVVLSNSVESVTSATAALTVIVPVPATLHSISYSAEAGFHFSLNGGSNILYTIEASTDLVNWTAVTNIFSSNGTLEFTDPTSSSTERFYRARWTP